MLLSSRIWVPALLVGSCSIRLTLAVSASSQPTIEEHDQTRLTAEFVPGSSESRSLMRRQPLATTPGDPNHIHNPHGQANPEEEPAKEDKNNPEPEDDGEPHRDAKEEAAHEEAEEEIHSGLSDPAIQWGNSSADKARETKVLTCPGDFVAKQGFSKPQMCASAKKMTNCSWGDIEDHIAAVCDQDCFCEAKEADKYMHIDACKYMCKDMESCVFTYTSNFGCRVYTSCDAPEANMNPDEVGHVDDWVTCERPYTNYSDQTVALYSERFKRYLMVEHGRLKVANNEVDENHIISAMRFVLANTTDLYAINEKTALPGASYTSQLGLGGPGRIALYAGANPDGKHWLSIGDGGIVEGGPEANENSVFTLCHEGANTIALHNTVLNGYLTVDSDEETASFIAGQKCCNLVEGIGSDPSRFKIVVPPPLTGREGTVESEEGEEGDSLPAER